MASSAGAGIEAHLLAGEDRGEVHRHVVNPFRRRAGHIQPDFAVRPIHFRVDRQMRADVAPARALVRVDAQDFGCLGGGLQNEFRQCQVHDAVLVQPHIDREPPVLWRHGGHDVVAAVVALLHVGGEKTAGRAQHGIGALEERTILGVQVVPPQALHGPWRFAHLVAPRRHGVRVHLAGHGVGGVEEEGAGQAELVLGISLAQFRQLLAQLDVRQVLLGVIGAEHAPPDLLGVVVHVIVAVPRSADVPAGPVAEEAGCDLARAQTTGQEILVVIPDLLKFAIVEFDRRLRPEVTPASGRGPLQFLRRAGGHADHLGVGSLPVALVVARRKQRDVQPEILELVAPGERKRRVVRRGGRKGRLVARSNGGKTLEAGKCAVPRGHLRLGQLGLTVAVRHMVHRLDRRRPFRPGTDVIRIAADEAIDLKGPNPALEIVRGELGREQAVGRIERLPHQPHPARVPMHPDDPAGPRPRPGLLVRSSSLSARTRGRSRCCIPGRSSPACPGAWPPHWRAPIASAVPGTAVRAGSDPR